MDLDNKSIEYYDSFANDIPADVLGELREFLNQHNPTRELLKLKVNKVIDQGVNSTNCGWFCCKFLIDRFGGKDWKRATGYDDHVQGEAAIERFKKQHGGAYTTFI